MDKSTSRIKFIDSKLLGRKRQPTETVVNSEENKEEEPEILIMKEIETQTTLDREETLSKCVPLLSVDRQPELNSQFHRMFLDYPFQNSMPPQMAAMDAGQPWIAYWVANSLKTMDPDWISDEYKERIAEKLSIISPKGGPFGGGMDQLPHIAGTYAAINSIVLCDNINDCWEKINRSAIYEWLLSLKTENGGFRTCDPVGEVDTRGVYCALSIASLLNIVTDELCEGVVDFLVNCQTYEGGFGGCPFEDEAHGGYTFCAVASLMILNSFDKISVEKLMEWCSARQYNEEKGLSGRSNKLVDGCYSFWVGATAAMIEASGYQNPINKEALREYILCCCQTDEFPGLRDKPGKRADFYHTNYVLLGLAISESEFQYRDNNKHSASSILSKPIRLRDNSSNLIEISPIYGLPAKDVEKFTSFFLEKTI
ncbi:hypothetical protein KAFR_0A06950 [Kazachstania africana CBS 2517]|uniref:Protein farnesyltransferase subunit beta n=1 Tax=Kazachstania africana (strain ATCC 22294 / BCRC 22015 / CBS 2517 / CECT 1963 / NBRC 1671 / NRRL Y-8276) TaxID=1071382 RepID=H2AP30_KAZAF|nr:hypothetical protein KAFR_0A06950 [Kazachstania africana CBS 2517]CCF56130.1 hypothetical protein KAFR_0A06950 [Kazachstania africana CBS 2517]